MASLAVNLTQVSASTSNALASGQAALNSVASMPAQAQAAYDNALADQEANGEANGISAATGLLSNGFDPSNAADMNAVIMVVAGACTALGFPEIGAALVLLDAAVPAITTALQNVGLISKPGTTFTGPPFTTAEVLADWGYPWPASSILGLTIPGHAPSPFGRLAIPVLAKYTADASNGKPVPDFNILTESLVAFWNKHNGGAAVQVFVPGVFANAQMDLYAAADASKDQIPYAFQPASSVPSSVWQPPTNVGTFDAITIASNPGPPSFPSIGSGPPFVSAAYGYAPIYTPPAPSLNLATYALTGADTLDLAQYALTVPAAAPPAPSILRPMAWGAGLLAAFYAVHRWL